MRVLLFAVMGLLAVATICDIGVHDRHVTPPVGVDDQ